MTRWQEENGVTITKNEDMDIDSFKEAVDGIDEWYQKELEDQGYEDAADLIAAFTSNAGSASAGTYDVEDHSNLGWTEQTWNFTCSTTETSTWAEGGRKFGELVEKATGGKIKVNVYAADQLTNGNQSEGIQALIDGDPVQISMHSNLIYSAFDPRFNVVSLPFLFDSVEDADAKLDGEAGEKLKAILDEYGLHCMGIAENGFRQLTNSRQEVRSVEDMKNLKIRVAGSNLLMECYKRWGADATNMNWSETYTALQQKTVEGQENPLPAIDAASVQEVQPYCSLWNANYDCLFFCINADIYNSLTPEQQEVIDECALPGSVPGSQEIFSTFCFFSPAVLPLLLPHVKESLQKKLLLPFSLFHQELLLRSLLSPELSAALFLSFPALSYGSLRFPVSFFLPLHMRLCFSVRWETEENAL